MQELPPLSDLLDALADGRAARHADTMMRRCWPGGAADRSDPVALEWVRRWSPQQGCAADPDISHN